MATTSPTTSNSQRCEGRFDSEMASEAECSGRREPTVCRSSAASEAALSAVTSSRESADEMQSESGVRATDSNLQQSETAVPDTDEGKAHNTNSLHVSIDDLPDEMLIKIFSHLSFSELIDIQKVCSRWRRLSQDAELWTDKEYHITYWYFYGFENNKGDSIDQEAVQTFCDAPNLRKVVMHRGAKSPVFRALYNRCHSLSELRLHSSQKLSYSVLKQLVEKCPKIHTLRISNQLLKSEKFSEAVSHLQHLRVLELEERYDGTPVLRPLGDGCPQLAEVDFGRITLDMDDLRHFLTAKKNTLKSICIKWTMAGKRCVLPLLTVCADSLERLQLHDFDIPRDETGEAFTALGTLKNLQEFRTSLVEPTPPCTAALAFTSGGLPKLRLLDLRSAFGLDDVTLLAICRGCPTLRELVVAGAELLSDVAFSQMYRLKHLEKLDVSCCKGLGGGLIPCLTKLPRLHTLLMEELEFPKLQPGLSSIVELPTLRCLSFNYSLITGVPFDKFPGKLVSLRELSVQWCRGDPKATDGLAEQMPDLKLDVLIDPEEPDADEDVEDEEDDAVIAEEENEENPASGNEGEAQNGDSEGDSRDLNEDDSDNAIWDESSIHVLFLEEI